VSVTMSEPWSISYSDTNNNMLHDTAKSVTRKLTRLTDIVTHVGGGTAVALIVYMSMIKRDIRESCKRE